MSNPYGYNNVMGSQMNAMAAGGNHGSGMGTANSITMSAMMPPPPPPPPQGMPDYSNGSMMQAQVSMQQQMVGNHGVVNSMAGMQSSGGMMGHSNMSNSAMLGQMMGSLQPPPPPPIVNPATNDQPLDFNVNRNKAPMPLQAGMSMDTNTNSENMNIVGSSSGNGVNNGNDSQEDSKDGILSSSGGGNRRDRERDNSRGRDRDRDRDNRDRRGDRGRDRERDRDRSNVRSRLSRERDRDNSPGSRDNRRDRRRDDNPRSDVTAGIVTPAPMDQYNTGATMGAGMEGQQQYGQMNTPWGPMWNPMGGAMAGPMGPMGPMTPMAGQMGGQMAGQMAGPMAGQMAGQMAGPMAGQMGGPMAGPMGPMTPMGPMAGPMGPTGEAPPITGEFRITWGMFGWMMSPEGLTVPIKNQLQCKEVTLVPPNRLAPPPTTRERPLGCRTVFVGGLPENVTEEMVVDVFERCGEITTVRLSKKNFAHIRYELEEFVENAIFLSGFRMRIDNNSDTANTGRLHVDYAQARDDLYEWECRQRALQREHRHRERMEAERMRPPSPPPVAHYTEHEAAVIADQLKGEEGSVPGMEAFSKAATTLVTWLTRGDCSKRNTGTFYSMIQSTNSQVRRLIAEKIQYEDELTKFREQTRARLQGIVTQFSQIEKVFTACSQQKVWDHFTKAQRRNIETWKKQAEKIKRIQLDDSDKEDADEMEVSDDEGSVGGVTKHGKPRKATANESLKEENDSLRCQLEAYKNEVDMVKIDLKTDMAVKDEQISTYKQTLQGMQQSLTDNVTRKRKDEARISDMQAKLKRLQDQLRLAKKDKDETKDGDDKDDDRELIYEDGSDAKDDRDDDTDVLTVSSSITTVDDKAAWLIGLTSTFLHIHPKGASVDYIWSYIQQFDKEIKPLDVESMLNQFPSVYKQITTGVGACLERKWVFTGFKSDKPEMSW